MRKKGEVNQPVILPPAEINQTISALAVAVGGPPSSAGGMTLRYRLLARLGIKKSVSGILGFAKVASLAR